MLMGLGLGLGLLLVLFSKSFLFTFVILVMGSGYGALRLVQYVCSLFSWVLTCHSISEISPSELRGMLMSGYQTVLQFAALIGFWGAFASHALFPSTSDLQWRIPVEIQLFPGALLLLGTMLIPESPRFWAMQGQWEKVEEALSWLRGVSREDLRVAEEADVIRASIEVTARAEYIHEGGFFKQAMRKDVRKRLGVGVGLMIAQSMVGLNALNYCEFHLLRGA